MDSTSNAVTRRSWVTPEEILAACRRQWLTILLLPVVAAGLAYAGTFLMTPQYRVEVVLLPQDADAQAGLLGSLAGQFGGLASLAGVDLARGSDKNEAIETLQSRSLTEEFLADRKLLPVLFREHWDERAQRWRTELREGEPTLADGVRYFDRRVRSVSEDRRTGIVRLTITWRDAKAAADWANELVRRTNARMRKASADEAMRILQYVERRAAEEPAVGVRESLFKVVESQYKSLALATAREDFAFRVIDPATPPDPDDIASPRRALIAAAGAVVGLLGVVALLLWDVRRASISDI